MSMIQKHWRKAFTVDGHQITAEVSPCSWMYEGYGLQLTVCHTSGANIYPLLKKPFEQATEEDAESLLKGIQLAKCLTSECDGIQFVDPTSNRAGFCEKCFLEKLGREFEEENRKRIEEGRYLRPDPEAPHDKYRFILPTGKKVSFSPSKPKRVEVEEGMVLVSGEVITKDKTRFDAVLLIDESSSGEHFGTFFLVPGIGIVCQDEKDFLKRIGKTKAQVFPYKYRYHVALHCSDHHVGEDGWSSR